MKEWLSNASESALRDFIIQIGCEDDELYSQIRRRFGKFSEKDQLSQLREDLRTIISKNTHRGFIDYQHCIRMCNKFNKLISEALNKQSKEKVGLGIQEILLVIQETVRILERTDDGSGSTTDTLDFAYDSLEQLALLATEVLSNTEKKQLVKAAIRTFNLKIFNNWDNFQFPILESILPLLTPETFDLVDQAAAKVPQRYSADNYSFSLSEDYYLSLKIKALIVIGDYSRVKKFMADHIKVNQVRELAIKFYMSQEDFRTAEKLAVNGSLASKGNGPEKVWLNYLEKIYLRTHDDRKLARVYKNRLLSERWLIDGNDYQKLKTILQKQGRWEQESSALLKEFSERLSPENYAIILSLEGNQDDLMTVVERKPLLIGKYGKVLYNRYPDKVTKLYHDTLITEIGNTRSHYRKLGRAIYEYAKYGNKETAKAWCQRLIEKYSRRSALVDEMKKVINSI